MPRHCRRLFFVSLCALFLGCSNANVPLNDAHVVLESRVKNHTRSAVFADVSPVEAKQGGLTAQSTVLTPADTRPSPPDHDGYFIGVSLSGGGSRSANFSAACMFQLEREGLMRHVDYISSVSGGSVAAALYCSSDDASWNPGDVQKTLTHPFATDLILRTLLPWNLLAFTFTDWDRSDVLAGVFRDDLFNRNGKTLTFGDLKPNRPRLLLNSTDLQTGRRFVFCNETFDELNSDLSRYPVAYAVAASAAFPVVLHPVTLRDYATVFPQYRHLIDGGVADNLGIQTLVETYTAQVDAARRDGRPDPYPNGAVFVIIDAKTQFNAHLSERSDLGLFASLTSALGLTSHSLVDRASSATLSETIVTNAADTVTAKELRSAIHRLDTDGYVRVADKSGHAVQAIYISLSQLDSLPNLPFENFTQAVNSIETYFNISPAEASNLYQAADLLVKNKLGGRIKEVVKEIEGGVAGHGDRGTR